MILSGAARAQSTELIAGFKIDEVAMQGIMVESVTLALVELAADYNITLDYESLTWGQHVSLWREARKRVQAVNHPLLGIVLDSFYILSRGDNLDELENAARKNLFCPISRSAAAETWIYSYGVNTSVASLGRKS